MRQMETQKKEYIDKLKKELDIVEEKWSHINDQSLMLGEDYRSHALSLMDQIYGLRINVQELEDRVAEGDEVF